MPTDIEYMDNKTGIGYACLTVGVPGTRLKSCTLKNIDADVLTDIIKSNLNALDKTLDYNIKNNIKLFRISSDIIPFGSHPLNSVKWIDLFSEQLCEIGKKALSNGIRLSMHPGQYTVLNSCNKTVVEHAVEDLRYHTRFLDVLGLGQEHKIVLHIGGVYGNKTESIQRFIYNYRSLDENIKNRLVIENDDRHYSIFDVLYIGVSEGIPVVFDSLHHIVNPDNAHSDIECIDLCAGTWKSKDGTQKLHYSQQDVDKRPGAHSVTLDIKHFLSFYDCVKTKNVDIMLEVKDKNLSAIKCINAIASSTIAFNSAISSQIKKLEKEWARYKYLVLEHSPSVYNEIRLLLKDKTSYPIVEFYKFIDEALMTPVKPGNAINAALHVWGYFKVIADTNIKKQFQNAVKKNRER